MITDVSNQSKSTLNGVFLHKGYAFLKVCCLVISLYLSPADLVARQPIKNSESLDVTAIASGALTCSTTSVTLQGSSSTAGELTYLWTGPGTIANATSSVASVSVPGVYTLTVTEVSTGATASASVVVTQNISTPANVVATASGILTCGTTSVTLTASSTTAGVVYNWTGPGGFTSTVQNPVVSAPGAYVVTVTNPANGCSTSVAIFVNQGTASIDVTTSVSGVITCANPSATLTASSATSGVSYSWTGPNGFTSDLQNPTVSVAGTYTVTVATTSGCSATSSVAVIQDIAAPTINIVNTSGTTTLTCYVNPLILTGSSTTAGATFQWIGSSGFSSSSAAISVTTPGTYVLTVTGPNGCTSTRTRTITQALVPPTVTAVVSGPISCSTPTPILSGISSGTPVTYSWTGPGGFTSTLPNPTVSVAGTYTLTTTTPGGCTATASIVVTQNTTAPNVSITNTTGTTTLTCFVNPLILTGSSSTAGATFQWSGPSGFSSSNAAITVTIPGVYTLTVTGTNGCISTRTRTITQALVSPTATATVSGVISCPTPTVTLSGSSSGTPVTYSWVGPNGFFSTAQNPTVSVAGTYVLTVTTPGGCTAASSVNVLSQDCAGTGANSRLATDRTINDSDASVAAQKTLAVVDVYPQPMVSKGTIALKPTSTVNVSVELYSIFNKKLTTIYEGEISEDNGNITFDTEGIENGIYIYRVRYANKQQQGRLIISH